MNTRKNKTQKGKVIITAALAFTLTAGAGSAFAASASADATRESLLTALTQALQVKDSAYAGFVDVEAHSTQAALLGKARAAGLISGFPDGTVRLQDAVTREQAAIMIARAKQLQLEPAAADVYPDAKSISNWSKGYVGAVTAEGYMKALPDGSFSPQTKLTADEVKKLAELVQQEPHVKVQSAKALSAHEVEVVLNGKFSKLEPGDIRLTAATGLWTDLDPKLTRYLTVKNVKTEVRANGQTVAILTIEEELEADGTIKPAQAPAGIPLLKAAYYTGDLQKDTVTADNILTYQINGAWSKETPKFVLEKGAWDGVEKRSSWINEAGVELATIDNNGTTDEILFLSYMYGQTKDEKYKKAVEEASDTLLKMQYPSGGWPQTYPARGNYSDYVTFNDNAMVRVLNVLTMMKDKQFPFDSGVVEESLASRLQTSLDKGLDYILKSQIKANGVLTAWCAQSDPVTYEPRPARAYEHPSISGSESVGIIAYLMSLPEQTPEVKLAVESALRYFNDVRVDGMKLDKKDPAGIYIVPDANKTLWYRFYEVGTNKPIFSGRDGIIKHNLNEIELERITGYTWAGEWPGKILKLAATTGYYENKVYVEVVDTKSKSDLGLTLDKGSLTVITGDE